MKTNVIASIAVVTMLAAGVIYDSKAAFAAASTTELLTPTWRLSGLAQNPADASLGRTGTATFGLGSTNAADNRTGVAVQDVKIPIDATTADLSYWLAGTNDGDGPGSLTVDFLYAGTAVATMANYAGKDTSFAYTLHDLPTVGAAVVNLASYRGEVITLRFSSDTGGTAFYLDDISLKVSTSTTPNLVVTTPAAYTATNQSMRARSLSFTALGAASPPAQLLYLNNTVFGTALSWAISDDAPWLSLSTASGTVPAGKPAAPVAPFSAVSVVANTFALAVGTYTATITITAAGSATSAVKVPVALTVRPEIAVNPGSLSFASSVAGIAPPAKTLSITNVGARTLSWTASSNQSWLRLSPASGTAPSTPSVSVVTTGLIATTYHGTITITAPGSKTVTVPVTLDNVVGTQLIKNGGFEDAAATPWILSGNTVVQAKWGRSDSKGLVVGSGSLLTPAGGSSAPGVAYQKVAIPANAATAELAYWYRIYDYDHDASTVMRVEVADQFGTSLALMNAYQRPSAPVQFTEQRSFGGGGGTLINLAAFRGKTVSVKFSVAPPAGSSTVDGFVIDDVSLKVATGTLPAALEVRVPAPTVSGVDPTSLYFSSATGGANPTAQVLNVFDTVIGTSLQWAISDDMPWLSVSPASGTSTAAVGKGGIITGVPATASVNSAGLAAGVYRGTISISAGGATGSPIKMPVVLNVDAAGTQLVKDGGFDSRVLPWALSGDARAYPGISGVRGRVTLGGPNYAAGNATQWIAIPSTASSANFTYWLSVTTRETSPATQSDKLFVEITDATGKTIATLATYSNVERTDNYVLKGVHNLLAYRGQAIGIRFRMTSDATLPTTFQVSGVSIR